MKNNNKMENLNNFTQDICKKYNLDENTLTESLNHDQKNFWNTLFKMIDKKQELENSINPLETIDKENIENTEKIAQTFNKEEITKDIENFFQNNPDEDIEIWNNYKNKNIGSPKDNNNNNNQIDVNAPTSTSTEKKMDSNIIKKLPSTQNRKKSFFVKKIINQSYNFSIGLPKKKRHQSILINPIKPLNAIKFIKNTQTKKNNQFDYKNKIKNNQTFIAKQNKNRRSLFLIDNNSHFDYIPKKSAVLNRKSVFSKQNNFNLKYTFSNSGDKNILNISEGKKEDKIFNKLTDKSVIDKIDEIKENENAEKILNYSDESDPSISGSNEIIISRVNSIEKKSKEEANNNNNNNKVNISKDENNLNDNNKDISDIKPKEEIAKIPVYKYKNTIFTIHKKQKPQPKSMPKLEPKHTAEPKKYLNNYVCHQVSISLNIKNKKDISKNKKDNKNNTKDYVKKNIQNFDKIISKSSKKKLKNIVNKKSFRGNKIIDTKKEKEKIKEKEKKRKKAKGEDKDKDDDKDKKKEKDEDKDKNEVKYMNNGNSVGNNIKKEEETNDNLKSDNQSENDNDNSTLSIKKDSFEKFDNKNIINEQKSFKTTSIIKKVNKKSNNINKFNHPNIKTKDLIYRNKMNNYFDSYINKSENNLINRNDYSFNKKPIKTIYNSQKEIIPKKAQIKYYKLNNSQNNKSQIIRRKGQQKIKIIKIKTFKKNDKNKIRNENNNFQRKSKYLQRYRETIENIMKNDDSIFNDKSQILYIKDKSKKILKNRNNSKDNSLVKKKDQNKSKVKFNLKSSEDLTIKKSKKNHFRSTDNIHKS